MRNYPLFDEKAVSTTLGYILTASIGITFFSILMLSLNSIFCDTPKAIVTESVYNDIGNEISTKMVDIYIISPINGSIDTKFDIPNKIANERYKIEMVGNSGDQEIIVSSLDSNNRVVVPINGIGHSGVGVIGEIYSGTTDHRIRFVTK
jgi:flagellar hook assembly protein FlgD